MVSSFKDYVSCRPTEFLEEDILLCESRYIDTEKQMKKFKGLKRFSYSPKVVEDETLYFRLVCESRLAIKNCKLCLILWVGMFWSCRKSVAPQKEASPILDKKIDELEAKLADLEDADDDMDDMDDEDDSPETPSMPQMQTPLASDMDMMHYMPSQVPIHLQILEFSQPYISHMILMGVFLPRQVHSQGEGPVKEGGGQEEDEHERLHLV